jgi:two-component system phosphate regulon sensor histidine kinase PhoR
MYMTPEPNIPLSKLIKAVGLISAAPIVVIMVYALMGRMATEHAILGIIAIIFATTFFIYPYISNIITLTDYVRALAEDKKVDEPDLSFLNNLEELSGAVSQLNKSWEQRKNQLEAALTENKIVIEVLPDALFILDKEQRIIRTNGMARHMFGHRIAHSRIEEILPVTELLSAIQNVKQVREVEFHITTNDIKRDYFAKVTKFPVNSLSSTDMIVTLHDLTELKQIRKMRADFVANASHEMKTPLASIIGLAETLQTTAKNDLEAHAEFLKIISEQATRMKTLIQDLLSLSKLEADTSPPDKKVDISKIVDDAKKHCEWAAKQKTVEVLVQVQPDLPQILGDEQQLSQVFINLISNAIKYGYQNSDVIVEAKITRKLPLELSEKFDKAIEVAVIDKSEGIAEEHIPRLTERFYRVDSARTRKLGGTGLGLAIVKHTLNRHSGVLKVESKVGVGSKFSVFLPIKE